MTYEEKAKQCALLMGYQVHEGFVCKAMGYSPEKNGVIVFAKNDPHLPTTPEAKLLLHRYPRGSHAWEGMWNPLEDDAQAIALAKKFRMRMGPIGETENCWFAAIDKPHTGSYFGYGGSLNSAIIECVIDYVEHHATREEKAK